MKTIKTDVYTFDELTDETKEKARDWYRSGLYDFDAFEHVEEDAKTIGIELVEYDLYRRECKAKWLVDAETVAKKIKENHGNMTDTYKCAVAFEKRVEDARNGNDELLDETLESLTEEFLHDLQEEYLAMLQREDDYINSDESIDENIRANEYTFTADGKRFG